MNQPSGRAFISSPTQTYLHAVNPAVFGRGFAVLAPDVIFEPAPQGIADGDMSIFMRAVSGPGCGQRGTSGRATSSALACVSAIAARE
jgi:hypothetical protein